MGSCPGVDACMCVCVCDRCPTSEDLGLVLYSVDRLTWGFQFHVPKFAGRDELYVVCDAFVCDRSSSTDHHCDRSCTVQPTTTRAPVRRRHVLQHTLPTAIDDGIGALLIYSVIRNGWLGSLVVRATRCSRVRFLAAAACTGIVDQGDRLWTGKPPRYLPSQLDQLSFLPCAGRETSSGQKCSDTV